MILARAFTRTALFGVQVELLAITSYFASHKKQMPNV